MPSLAERLEPACKAVGSDPGLVDLPARLSVFGASRLPANQLQVLAALGESRDVHLWLAEASPQTVNATSLYRRDANADEVRNPLLRSFGRDARELRQRLDLQMPDAVHDHLASDLQDGTMLGQLQCQIRDNTISSNASRDRSIQVHACHGQARQAEVVHEIVLSLLQNDPTLEARDILIMCPDLDAFAPLLSAAFCDDSLRLRIADRTPEQGNLVLVALATLLDLVTGRTELSTVLDFAAQPPVRQKFGFDDDALDRLAELTEQAGIRWGLDDQTRADFLVRIPTGTWAWGLDRMLLGVAMSEDGLPIVNGVLPVDDVNSGDVALVGQLAELITRLRQARDTLQGRHSASQWVATISAVLEDLTQVWGLDAWQMPNALAVVSGLAENAGSQADSLELSLADIRWLLEEVLTGRPTRSNFRSGDLTVCGLAPMRSVPHRVICLVGMDDGAFPARSSPTATTSWPGTHSSANVTCAARTGNCCSTRSWRPPTRWSSRTPAPTSARTNPDRPAYHWANCWTLSRPWRPALAITSSCTTLCSPSIRVTSNRAHWAAQSRSATTSGHLRRLVDPASLARPPPPRCWTTCRRSTSRNCLRRTSARSWPPLSTRSCALVWDCRCARTTIRLRSRFQSH